MGGAVEVGGDEGVGAGCHPEVEGGRGWQG